MKEVKKCSISGVAFTMDADAYQALETYLESLTTTYKDTADGAEIVADIEARIAELILSTQDNTRVVEKPLIQNIIRQMGTAEDISRESVDHDLHCDTPRIPRRLYRDTENAKLGGVCAGIGKYFDIDPVWVRLGLFLPLLFVGFGWIPFLHWFSPMFGNLFGIFMICYFIMWFAVPAARSARQKLEMNGEKITAQSIGQVTAASATACTEPDAMAKPIIAEVVSVFGKMVLILLKIITGFIVFGLIMAACGLIIGLFALIVGGEGFFTPAVFGNTLSIWTVSLAILTALILVILLIYVLMCLIASRKPGSKTVMAIFLLWLASICAVSIMAIRENAGAKFQAKHRKIEQVFQSKIIIDGDTTTLERLLEDYDGESVIEEGQKTLHISMPSKSLNITVDKNQGALQVNANGRKVSIKASESDDEAPAETSEQEADDSESRETPRGSAAQSR
ncbi:PspC domain-containing protein [Alistipes sp.]|uniref:PspC domain-containing protein n=1 Tax=Alistipes sp. TaxID=1872444 RepID=UPI0025C0AEDD|nr:PspC domain-containing protein [Alistipes sp.]